MSMNRKWMTLILLFLGAMIVSGCGISREGMMAYNEAKDAFQRATLAGAKQCAPCEYATAEAALAHADDEVAEGDEWRSGYFNSKREGCQGKIVRGNQAVRETTGAKGSTSAGTGTGTAATATTTAAATSRLRQNRLRLRQHHRHHRHHRRHLHHRRLRRQPPPAPLKEVELDTIYFDVNKTNISPTAAKALDRNGTLLRDNPKVRVEIGGHSDSTGSEAANMKASEKRAQSAKKYLQDKFNIAADRMTVKGYGATKPIADNKTKEGQAKNRRVEFRVIK